MTQIDRFESSMQNSHIGRWNIMTATPIEAGNVRIGTKVILGVALPLLFVTVCARILYDAQHEFGTVAAISVLTQSKAIPVMLVINSLLMIP
jgi:hypothetical protein